ncbi:MAG: hypothetical protein WAM58_18525 [Candidatus Acidiferrum sp.]
MRIVAGAVALAGFPFVALQQYPFGLIRSSYESEAYHVALCLEVAFALICGAIFYLQKPWLPTWLILVIFFVHFGAWGWVTSSYVNAPLLISTFRGSPYYHSWAWTVGLTLLSILFNFGFPIIGLLASMLWVGYIKCPAGRQRLDVLTSKTNDASAALDD